MKRSNKGFPPKRSQYRAERHAGAIAAALATAREPVGRRQGDRQHGSSLPDLGPVATTHGPASHNRQWGCICPLCEPGLQP